MAGDGPPALLRVPGTHLSLSLGKQHCAFGCICPHGRRTLHLHFSLGRNLFLSRSGDTYGPQAVDEERESEGVSGEREESRRKEREKRHRVADPQIKGPTTQERQGDGRVKRPDTMWTGGGERAEEAREG